MEKIKKLTFYELNPRYFKDSSGDGIGDLKGLCDNFDYFNYLNVDAIILQDTLLSDGNGDNLTFDDVDPIIGDMDDMAKLLSLSKESKQKILIELNIGTIKENHVWFKSAVYNQSEDFKNVVDFKKDKEWEDLNYGYNQENSKYYLIDDQTQEVPINWNSTIVIDNFMKVIRFWNKLGIGGFVIKAFEYLADEKKQKPMSEETLKELRKFYRLTKEINDKLLIVAKTHILETQNIRKYVVGEMKVFDYILSTQTSIIDLSKKYLNDVIGSFSVKALNNHLKQISVSSANIISFGSNLSSRPLSRWLNDDKYIEESAKALGMLLLLSKASSSIYMGEEIGMPNIGLTTLDDFQTPDLEDRKKVIMQDKISEKEFMNAQVLQNPINSRSLMPWNDFKNGGFSQSEKTITPAISRYKEINVKRQYDNVSSILNFYRQLIRISRDSQFSSIFEKGRLGVSSIIPGVIKYRHKLIEKEVHIIVNLTDSIKYIKKSRIGKVIMSSHNKDYPEPPSTLQAFEAIMISRRNNKNIPNTQEIEELEQIIQERARKRKAQLELRKRIEENKKYPEESFHNPQLKAKGLDNSESNDENQSSNNVSYQEQNTKSYDEKIEKEFSYNSISNVDYSPEPSYKDNDELSALQEIESGSIQKDIEKTSEFMRINQVTSESADYEEELNKKDKLDD